MQIDGTRDARRRETKRRIIDEAAGLVEAGSFDSVTVEDICRAAGISRRTFFNYMDSKDEAVLGVFPFAFTPEGMERIRTTPADNVLDLIITSLEVVDECYGPSPETRKALLEANPSLLHAEAARKRTMLTELGIAVIDHFERFPDDLKMGGTAKDETQVVVGLFRTTVSRYLWSPCPGKCDDPIDGLRSIAKDITTYTQELTW